MPAFKFGSYGLGVSKGAPFGTGCVYIHGVPVFFELLLLSGCQVFVRPLQDVLSGICGDIVMRLSGLAKLKNQSKCSMRGSVKGGEIPAIPWYVQSEEGAQVNGIAVPFIVVATEFSRLTANYHQYEQPSELSPLPISSDWAGISKSRLQNVERLSRNPSLITGSETLGFIGSFWTSRNLSLFRGG